MNILLSLLIYNPIEAYTLVLLCSVISCNKVKYNTCMILKIYIFGVTNFIIQFIPYLWFGTIAYLVGNLLVAYIFTPIVLKVFYVRVIKKNLTICQSIVSVFIYCMFNIVIPMISDALFKTHTLFYNNDDLHEFVINIIIFFVQITLYKFIERKRIHYEEFCKTNFRKGNS